MRRRRSDNDNRWLLRIALGDGVPPAPVILLTGTTVAEDATVGTTVGTLSIGNTFTGSPVYTLVDSAGGKFSLTGALIKVAAALDYETATTHNIVVSVSGITPVAPNRTLTITVTDVLEPVIVLTGMSIAENASIGAVVGTLSIANAYTGTPVFTLPGSAGGKFAVSGNNITVASALDYETAPTHSISVGVSGITPAAPNVAFAITVVDVVEVTPVIQLTGTTVNEDAAVNTTVGTLSVTGSYTGTPIYILTDSAGGKFNISGTSLRVNAALDYETASTHSVTISVSGLTPAAANKTFTIVVLDVTESASATWNQSDKDSGLTLTAPANVVASSGTDAGFVWSTARATASASTEKYYCEITVDSHNVSYLSYSGIGCASATKSLTDAVCAGGGSAASFGMAFDGSVYDYTTGGAFGTLAACPVGSTVGMAVDLDNHRVWFRVITGGTPGNWNNSGTANPATNTGGLVINALMDGITLFPAVSHVRNSAMAGTVTTTNFGATTYAAAAPSGFSNWGGGGAVGVTKNIVTDYGAVGDAQWARATLSITTNSLLSATAIWPSATLGSEYIGKSIVVGRCGGTADQAGGGTPLRTTITGWTSSTQITLGANCVMPLSSEPNVIVAWGTNNGKHMPPLGADASDGPFETFRKEFAGQAVTLTIPAGKYLISSGQFGFLFDGIRNITVNATGATICGGTFALGANNQSQWYGHSGYTASVSAGATSVTLSTPSQVSRFAVGRYALMTGFGLQYGGFPSNHQRFEYVYVTAIDSDSGSPTYGKITFLAPLVNSYLSTWPLFIDETGTTPPPENGQYTSGGPATLYALSVDFNHTAVINNLTFAHHAQMGTAGLSLTLNGCVFESIYGPHATACKTVVFNDCLGIQCTMEVDKLITSFTMNRCDWGGLTFQSASVVEFIADDTDIRYSVVGSPLKATFRNGSTIGTVSGIGAFTPGCDYGYPSELIVTSSQIKNFGRVTTHESGYVIPGKDGSNRGINVDYTMSGGVITVPVPNPAAYTEIYTTLWPVTDGKAFIQDGVTGEMIGLLKITNATQSGGNALIATTLSGGWPSRSGHKLYLVKHPAPICTFTNVHGCDEVEDLSNAGAAGLPLYSYTKRTYTGLIGASEYWQLWGRIKKIVVIVTTPSAGAAQVSLFDTGTIKMSDYSSMAWVPSIDLNKTGTRTFDATAGTYPVTWSSTAVAASDTLTSQTFAVWAPGNFRVVTSGAMTGAVFSVEVITDQGF